MLVLGAAEIRNLLPISRLVDVLRDAFETGCSAPPRQVLSVPGGDGHRLLLSMPAFHLNGSGMVKLATVCPDNRARGVPTIHGAIVVFSESGVPIALLDGSAVTHLRTGAASALASRYLSREDSKHLLVMGTGSLAPSMAAAHCSVRPIERVTVWGRRSEQAALAAEAIRSRIDDTIEVSVASSVKDAVATADIVSCCTSSTAPVFAGEWLQAGAFVDLVGSFSPAKRESDDETVRRARIFVDTFDGAMEEAGDILDPLARGVIRRDRIEGELADLVRGRVAGRRGCGEIILFKSVGTAIEDLAAAREIVAAASRCSYFPISARV